MMTGVMEQLFTELDRERQALLAVVQGLSEQQMLRKDGVGAWSIKDTLGHLAAWEQVMTDFLPERCRTGVYPAVLKVINADQDGWNRQQVEARAGLSGQEQIEELYQCRSALLETLRGLGEEALQQVRPWPQWQGTLAEYIVQALNEHEREHREMISC